MNANLVAVPIADLESLIARAGQRWLSIDQAATYCGLSAKSLSRAVARSELTPSTAVRGKRIFDRRQLDAWMMSGMD